MNKKELKKQYLQTIPPMGVYQVKNTVTGKIFLESSLNIQGRINSCRFQLTLGSHRNKALQADVMQYGIDNFVFEILDYVQQKEDLQADYTEDLEILENLWIDKLQPFGDNGYNKRKS